LILEFLDRHLNQVLSFQLKFSLCYGQAVSMQETFFNKYFITLVHHPLRVNLPLSIFHLVLNRPKWRFITKSWKFRYQRRAIAIKCITAFVEPPKQQPSRAFSKPHELSHNVSRFDIFSNKILIALPASMHSFFFFLAEAAHENAQSYQSTFFVTVSVKHLKSDTEIQLR
jgi:hypothetical protein